MNKQGFDISTKKGLAKALKFLGALVELGSSREDTDYTYNEIHLTSKDGWLNIEWEESSCSGEWGGQFIFFNEDAGDVLKKRVEFPDRHYDIVDPEDAAEAMDNWVKSHPNWENDSYGEWHDTEKERANGLRYKDLKELESKPADNIFQTIELQPMDRADFGEVLAIVPGDVAHRSSVIVIGPDLLAAATEFLSKRDWTPDDYEDETLFKVGEVDYQYEFSNFPGDIEDHENHSHVYCCNELGPVAIFMTDGLFPIGRVDVAEEAK